MPENTATISANKEPTGILNPDQETVVQGQPPSDITNTNIIQSLSQENHDKIKNIVSTIIQEYNTNNPDTNNPQNKPDLFKQFITDLKQFVSDKKTLTIGEGVSIKLHMKKKKTPQESIPYDDYSQIQEIVNKNNESLDPDKSQNPLSWFTTDIFYTLKGTIGPNKKNGVLDYNISINEMTEPSGTCPPIPQGDNIFEYNQEKTYNDLNATPDILREPLIEKQKDYSDKNFQLCIKTNINNQNIENTTLVNMTIY